MSVTGAAWLVLKPERVSTGGLIRDEGVKTVLAFCQDLNRLVPSSFDCLFFLRNADL